MQRALVSFGSARCRSLTRLRCIYVTGIDACHGTAESSSAVRGWHSSEGPTLAFRHFASRRVVAFPLAQTGEGISECELVAWSVKAGDTVAQFDKLCDVQSDKASIEITSRYAGLVLRLHHKQGDVVKVGAPLVDLEVADDEVVAPEHLAPAPGAATAPAATAAPAAAAPAATADQVLPAAAAPANNYIATTVAAKTATVTAASTPATAAAASSSSGAQAGAPHAAGGVGMAVAATPSVPAPGPQAALGQEVQVHASPAVRALARELGVPLASVSGTGPGGRVTKADVMRHAEEVRQQAAAAAVSEPGGGGAAAAAAGPGDRGLPAAAAAAVPQRSLSELMAAYQQVAAAATAGAGTAAAAAGGGEAAAGQVVPLKGYRRAMVKAMTAAAALPQFHLCDEVAVDRLVAVRNRLKDDPGLKKQSIKLTLLPLLIKALSVALSRHPHINASMGPGEDSLVLHPHHNIGVAMATPTGLVVPNIKRVERLSVSQIALQLALLQQLAAAGRLPAEALAGGTITVSNIGTLSGTYATPLVVPPEVAIVALGRVQLLPRYPQGTTSPAAAAAAANPHHHHPGSMPPYPNPLPVPVSVLPVSWGADHRVVDGAALAAFSATWKELLEEPDRLLLHLA